MAFGGKNNKRYNSNYFVQNIQKNGDDFLDFKNSRNLELDAPRIFRDLARGNIDIDTQGFYFLNSYLLNTLINVANEKYTFHAISYQGVSLLINNISINNNAMVHDDILTTQHKHKLKYEAYCIIFNGLASLRDTRDLNYLYSIVNNLTNYKYAI